MAVACKSAKYAEFEEPEDVDSVRLHLVESGVIDCPDPADSPQFEEVGLSIGLSADHIDDTAPKGHVDGPSIALADVNNDGYPELAVLREENGESMLYSGVSSGFERRPGTLYPGRAGLFADADADGTLDLIVGGILPVWMSLRDDGSWTKESWPDLDPPEERETRSHVHDLSLGDFDDDGVNDLYVVRTAVPFGNGIARNDRLLRLAPEGLTVDRDSIPEEVGLRHGFDALSFDDDGDGDLDTYLVHDHGASVGASTLLRNEGGRFTDATDDCFCSLQVSAKGADIADLNNDGLPEIFVTGAPLNHLLSRDEDGWLDISDSSGIRDGVSTAAGWGGTFLDVDNDGSKDILLVQGDRWNPGETILPDGSAARFDEPIHLMRQEGGQFTDIAQELGLSAQGSFRAVMASDLNQDGVQDLLITQVSDRTLAYISQGCTAANWVAIDAPVGSRVTISAGSSTQTDWARVGRGYQSTSRAPLHFGLGAEAVIDRVTIASPGGATQTFEGPIDARQTLTIEE